MIRLRVEAERTLVAHSCGFTLLEMMIVVAMLGALTALALPRYLAQLERAGRSKVINQIHLMEAEIKTFEFQSGRLPLSLLELGLDGELDSWGNPFQFTNIAVEGTGKARKDKKLNPINTDYDLYSMGPDGVTASSLVSMPGRDDIVRANDGAFVGLAADY